MRKLVVILVAGMLLGGCGGRICKSGAGQSEFNSDSYNCKQRSRSLAQFGDVYNPFEEVSAQNECMAMKGWKPCE